ncbi:hypothetical protein SELMODRAFT_424217 [Selaginella moellendorffii]|uniref:Prolyl 4-hydroxylase alpha subunit Fe(2+) 2OG dioxygenase domain-containing protein n=1 Tax=Selaginella moellendorffii TaxID=88036 RepID=D8SP67_SELML|nr:hypothetical protein SELMODRAFT_424217 [Selaginella moellendorffii]
MSASLLVEGAGSIHLPLSQEGLARLKSVCQQAPYGLGERTLVDTDVRKAWQVNPDKISCPENPSFFSSVVHGLAAAGLAAMGLDPRALELDVKLYKLLLYEAGGHFKFHRDTEKDVCDDDRPAPHSVRAHRRSSRGSSSKYFSTIFFCDCEHQLEEVTGGSRLSLVFSLVRNNVEFIAAENVPSFVSSMPRVKELLREWVEKGGGGVAQRANSRRSRQLATVARSNAPRMQLATRATRRTQVEEDDSYDDDDYAPVYSRNRSEYKRKLLAIPLAHKYSKTSLSFAGLKGQDRVVAAMVRACEFLDVHLCMLTKHKTVTEDVSIEYGIDNRPAKFQRWEIDVRHQVLRCALKKLPRDMNQDKDEFNERDLFDFLEDEFRGTGMMAGNEGGTNQYFYHVAVLVVWPRETRMQTICCSPIHIDWLLDWIEEEACGSEESKRRNLEQAVDAFHSLPEKFEASPGWRLGCWKFVARLLDACVKSGARDAAFLILRTWGTNMTSFDEFATAVKAYGWEACKGTVETVMNAVKEHEEPVKRQWWSGEDVKAIDPPEWYGAVMACGGLALRLDACGCRDGAIAAAKMFCGAISSELPVTVKYNEEKHLENGIAMLLEFCIDARLGDEVSHILGRVPWEKLSSRALAKLRDHFPERREEVDEFWTWRKECFEDLSGSWSKEKYMEDVVKFVMELESLGDHDTAVVLASELLFADFAKVENLKDHEVVALLLLDKAELIPRDRYMNGSKVIKTMRRAASLVGLKEKDGLRTVFGDLCKAELPEVADRAEMISWVGDRHRDPKLALAWKDQKEFFETLFWLGEEEVLGAMVECVSKRSNLVKWMLDKDEGLVEEAMRYGGNVRDAMRKVVDSRMEYLSREPSFGNYLPPPPLKVMKICGFVDARQVYGNPRHQRRVHEIMVDKWKSTAFVEEMEHLQELKVRFV